MRIRNGCIAGALALALPGAALAQNGDERFGAAGYDTAPQTNIYVEGRAALTLLMDQDVSGGTNGDASFDPGFSGSLAVGYHVLDPLRVELEAVAGVSDIDDSGPLSQQAQQRVARNRQLSPEDVAGQGDTVTMGGFVNGAYDIDTGTAFTPYIGGGLGVLRIDAEYGAFGADDTDVMPAYQVLTGVSWHVVRQTALTLGYHYRRTIGEAEFDSPGGKVKTDYGSHGFQIGLRYRF